MGRWWARREPTWSFRIIMFADGSVRVENLYREIDPEWSDDPLPPWPPEKAD